MKPLVRFVTLISLLACTRGVLAQSCRQPDTRRSEIGSMIDVFNGIGRASDGADPAGFRGRGIDLRRIELTAEVLQFVRTGSDADADVNVTSAVTFSYPSQCR